MGQAPTMPAKSRRQEEPSTVRTREEKPDEPVPAPEARGPGKNSAANGHAHQSTFSYYPRPMARYTATNTVHCWKAHRCMGCGAAYRYRFTRKATGQGRRPEAAQAALRLNLDRLVATSVDVHPCPNCGVRQPDMLAQGRAKRFGWLLLLIIVAVTGLLLAVAADGLPIETAAGLLALVGGLAAVLLAWFALRDPNRDLAANRQAAAALLQRDQLRLDQPGAVDLPREGPAWRRLSLPAAGALALGTLLLPAPEIVRALRGWPTNADFYPAVVGPGDRATFYLTDHVDSIKGYWRGEPRVTVTNAAALGLAPTPENASDRAARGAEAMRARLENLLKTPTPPAAPAVTPPPPPPATLWPATSRNDVWGGTMSVKSSEKHASHALWTEINVPDEPGLAGKTARLDVRLLAAYPQMEGPSSYRTVRSAHARQAALALAAEPRAGTLYRNLWLTGALGGGTLLALTAWAMRRATWKGVPNTQLGLLPLDDAPAVPAPPVHP